MNSHVRISRIYFMRESVSFGDMKKTYEQILNTNITTKINTNVNYVVYK